MVRGTLPYREFFHTQMPYLMYFYGLVGRVLGRSWYSARITAALVACGIAWIVYLEIRSRVSPPLAALATCMVSFSAYGLTWFTAVKTHGLATFLLVAAVHIEGLTAERRGDRTLDALVGLLLGLSIGVRLNFLLVVPAFAAGLIRRRAPIAAYAAFGAGAVAGLLPAGVIAVLAPRQMYFSVLGYHGMRSGGGFVGDFGQKLDVLRSFVGGHSETLPGNLQLAALAALAATGVVVTRSRRRTSTLVTALLAVACLLPTPVHAQYFAVLVPFLAIDAVAAIEWIGRRVRARSRGSRLLTAAAGVLVVSSAALYLAAAGAEVHRFTVTGRAGYFYAGGTEPVDWRISTVRSISRTADRHVSDAALLTWWPGYAFETSQGLLSGFENNFALQAANLVSRDAHAHYRLLSTDNVIEVIRRGDAGVIVAGNEYQPAVFDPILRDAGYVTVATIHGARVLVLERASQRR